MEVNSTLDKVKLTWALPKQPKVMEIQIEKFKQLHHLKHEIDPRLEDFIPFNSYVAGFDDNTFEIVYRPIYFHVKES